MSNQQTSNRRQSSNMPPDHAGLLIASVVMMLSGWLGLYYLIWIAGALPRIGGELWLFFGLVQVAITGTVIPLVRFVNVRFTSLMNDVPPSGVIVRQSIWISLFCVTCVWLQIPRALSLPLALFVALVFIVVEIFLRTRELAAERE